MGEQKIGDKLRLMVQASAINGWTKFIEDTFSVTISWDEE